MVRRPWHNSTGTGKYVSVEAAKGDANCAPHLLPWKLGAPLLLRVFTSSCVAEQFGTASPEGMASAWQLVFYEQGCC